ncbi:MAG: response regulator [Sulfurospirillaceae bacterium]|nr:response regulator [Sulfurospirillaceae bacterium]
MPNYKDLNELKRALCNLSLLYIEENDNLQNKIAPFLEKNFSDVYLASDSDTGMELFNKYHPSFVITCIDLPKINGLQLARMMRVINPRTKIIITSLQDEKSYLLESINLHIDGYLIKPFKLSSLLELLYSLAIQHAKEHDQDELNRYIYKIFNKQQSLIMLIRDDQVVLANETLFGFMDIKPSQSLQEKFKTLDELFLPHPTFLYRQKNEEIGCLEKIKQNMDQLYNVKLLDQEKKEHHFILRLTQINEKESLYILSLTDITELNLLGLYDKKNLDNEEDLSNEQTILHLFNAAKEASATIRMYNFYKGLMISNDAIITEAVLNDYVFKTSINQQKAVKFEQKVVIHCELFPYDIESADIKSINFTRQTVEIGKCNMLKSTPTERKSLVLEPDEKHNVSFVFNEYIYDHGMRIKDISKEAVRIYVEQLPLELQEGDEIYISMSFHDGPQTNTIRVKSYVLKIIPYDKIFYIVARFAPTPPVQKSIVDYMISRQMTLVREFKSLQIQIKEEN